MQVTRGRIHYPKHLANDIFSAKLQGKTTVFEELFHIGEELFSVRAVDDAMVVSQREVSHLADRDVIVTFGRCENLWTFFDRADAKDRDLRLVDDGCSEQPAKDTGVRYR